MAKPNTNGNTTTSLSPTIPGREISGGGISFAKLRVGAGEEAKATGEPVLCGWISGVITGMKPDTGTYGDYVRFEGDFVTLNAARTSEGAAHEIYLPRASERYISSVLAANGPGVGLILEGWAVPDPRPNNARGYRYVIYLRLPNQGHLSPARRLAIEAGLLPPPPAPPMRELPGSQETYDPETGEVLSDAAE